MQVGEDGLTLGVVSIGAGHLLARDRPAPRDDVVDEVELERGREADEFV